MKCFNGPSCKWNKVGICCFVHLPETEDTSCRPCDGSATTQADQAMQRATEQMAALVEKVESLGQAFQQLHVTKAPGNWAVESVEQPAPDDEAGEAEAAAYDAWRARAGEQGPSDSSCGEEIRRPSRTARRREREQAKLRAQAEAAQAFDTILAEHAAAVAGGGAAPAEASEALRDNSNAAKLAETTTSVHATASTAELAKAIEVLSRLISDGCGPSRLFCHSRVAEMVSPASEREAQHEAKARGSSGAQVETHEDPSPEGFQQGHDEQHCAEAVPMICSNKGAGPMCNPAPDLLPTGGQTARSKTRELKIQLSDASTEAGDEIREEESGTTQHQLPERTMETQASRDNANKSENRSIGVQTSVGKRRSHGMQTAEAGAATDMGSLSAKMQATIAEAEEEPQGKSEAQASTAAAAASSSKHEAEGKSEYKALVEQANLDWIAWMQLHPGCTQEEWEAAEAELRVKLAAANRAQLHPSTLLTAMATTCSPRSACNHAKIQQGNGAARHAGNQAVSLPERMCTLGT